MRGVGHGICTMSHYNQGGWIPGNRAVYSPTVCIVKIQAVFPHHFRDTVGMGDLRFTEQATNDRLAYLVVTFLIEIDFVDSPADGDNEYLFQAF